MLKKMLESSNMALLDDFPNELIREILSYLDLDDLTISSCVSHPLNSLAEPITWELHILLCTLLLRPALANYVRHLDLQ